MILGLGIPELLIILIVILVIFGPKNLPKIGSALGKTVKNVREGMEEGRRTSPRAPSRPTTTSRSSRTTMTPTPPRLPPPTRLLLPVRRQERGRRCLLLQVRQQLN